MEDEHEQWMDQQGVDRLATHDELRQVFSDYRFRAFPPPELSDAELADVMARLRSADLLDPLNQLMRADCDAFDEHPENYYRATVENADALDRLTFALQRDILDKEAQEEARFCRDTQTAIERTLTVAHRRVVQELSEEYRHRLARALPTLEAQLRIDRVRAGHRRIARAMERPSDVVDQDYLESGLAMDIEAEFLRADLALEECELNANLVEEEVPVIALTLDCEESEP